MTAPGHVFEPKDDPDLRDRLGALTYDIGSRAIFALLGGIDRLRGRTLDALQVRPGDSVLELGCGSGALTEILIRRGASVVGVDQSEGMLRRARRRAPLATLIRADILEFKCTQKFDRVLIAFVLHHMDAEARLFTLTLARNALKPGGLIGVLDWAEPDTAGLRWALHQLLTAVEPSSALDWIESGFDSHLGQADLVSIGSRTLAMGVAKVVVARANSRSAAWARAWSEGIKAHDPEFFSRPPAR
jgi:ubiquinone/menaquinone biosynthesis C-methylase UbiE